MGVCPNCEVAVVEHSERERAGCWADLFGVAALSEEAQAVYEEMR